MRFKSIWVLIIYADGGFRCSSALCLFIFLVYNEPPYGTSFSSFSKFYTWCPLEIGNSEGQILKICLTYLFEVYTCWLHANCHICQISNFAIHTIWDTLYITLRHAIATTILIPTHYVSSHVARFNERKNHEFIVVHTGEGGINTIHILNRSNMW